MADIKKAFHGVLRLYKDMGDGTYAERVTAEGASGGGSTTGASEATLAEVKQASEATTIEADLIKKAVQDDYAYEYTYDTEGNRLTATRTRDGVTQLRTFTYNAQGFRIAKSDWVFQ